MFQFPGFPAYSYFIHCTLPDSSSGGLPHSEICGSRLIYSSPQLIAVSHVLLRLPVPRHSPYALLRLNFFWFSRSFRSFAFDSYQFLKVIFNLAFCKIVFYPLRKNHFLFLVSLYLLRFLVSSLYSVFKDHFLRVPSQVSASTYFP